MKNQIVYTKRAIQDLDDIWEFFVDESGSTKNSERIVDGILDSIDILADFPHSGVKLMVDEMNARYRYIVHKNYKIFYHFDQSVIYIERVIHNRRNYMSLLFDD